LWLNQPQEIQMELKITLPEAERLLLEWAQAKFPDMFDQVETDRYSYTKTFTFTKQEPKDESQ
jgi:hypothetical protein